MVFVAKSVLEVRFCVSPILISNKFETSAQLTARSNFEFVMLAVLVHRCASQLKLRPLATVVQSSQNKFKLWYRETHVVLSSRAAVINQFGLSIVAYP